MYINKNYMEKNEFRKNMGLGEERDHGSFISERVISGGIFEVGKNFINCK